MGSRGSSSPGRVQGTACPSHKTAHVSAVPCSYSSLRLSAPQIPYNRGSKAYINDERERDERSHSLMCPKGTQVIIRKCQWQRGWLHKLHRAQHNQKWTILALISRKASAFNSPFGKPLNIWDVHKQVYLFFFFALCFRKIFLLNKIKQKRFLLYRSNLIWKKVSSQPQRY